MLAKNIYIWTLIVLMTISNMAIHFYVNLSSSLQFIVWLSWFVLMTFLFLLTTNGKELKNFFLQAYNEVKKVVWPSKQETIQTTMIVIVMVAITGTILWLLDNAMIWLIAKLTRLG